MLKPGKNLVIYLTAGCPDLQVFPDLLAAVLEGGADLIEVGLPFSDPSADGPVIQEAAKLALQAGTTGEKVLTCLSQLPGDFKRVPLLLMTYANPLLQLREAGERLKEAGIKGVIVPDVPLEERYWLDPILKPYGLAQIPMATPTTPVARLREFKKLHEPFLYCISVTGTTGIRAQLANRLTGFLTSARENSGMPVVVGFGFSRPEQMSQVRPYCDGVVVGSAVMEKILEDGTSPRALKKLTAYVRELKLALGDEEGICNDTFETGGKTAFGTGHRS